jgi:CheY-like chemotaxis protein
MARVLVVDDLEIFRVAITRALRMLGHTVVELERPELALDRASEVEFDLALLDVRMPGMDGITLARRLRIVALGAPRIVMVTAQPEELAGLDTAPGEFGYLQKPFRFEELCRVVERALGGAAATG